jgi:hypothetical protein
VLDQPTLSLATYVRVPKDHTDLAYKKRKHESKRTQKLVGGSVVEEKAD